VLLCAVAVASAALLPATFNEVQSSSDAKVVVFFRSSNPDSAAVLAEMSTASESAAIKALSPSIRFVSCDGDDADNTAQFESAQFGDATYVFTSLPVEGIQQYQGEKTAKDFTAHLLEKFAPFDDEDVVVYDDQESLEELLEERPQFIKCFEQWCGHCKSLKPTFARAASAHKDRVGFVEVECSKSADSKAFCQSHGVQGYPTLFLLTEDGKIPYNDHARNSAAFGKFFDEHLSENDDADDEDEDDEDTAPEHDDEL